MDGAVSGMERLHITVADACQQLQLILMRIIQSEEGCMMLGYIPAGSYFRLS